MSGRRMRRCWSFPARRDGVVLVDAGAQDDEHVDGLVDFITSVFDARPELHLLDGTMRGGAMAARLCAKALRGSAEESRGRAMAL